MHLLFLALSTTALALPTAKGPHPTSRPTHSHTLAQAETRPRKTTHLYICPDAGFKGACSNEQVALGQCYNAPPPSTTNSSTGPDKGHFCTAYPDYDCTGKAFPFINPGMGSRELWVWRCD
ncbi:hypothetical protein BU23DRAFT_551709 [Bimuria novae-zelandiae CBS 107.79]|uniref:Uncharacterized protein n=1 Tax=Bimuria novae-zelandiae CBS 107.79 TaxID=1447943 RepID=A0A6A5VSM4_9PLEO|nr:hypothetical protein BU23DRAFT_551709 [Bimuria novae-zelandiae CBS 107.79]